MSLIDHHSPLLDHARRELDIAGLTPEDSSYDGKVAESVIELIEVFEAQNHSTQSAEYASTIFAILAQGKVLTPYSQNPAEWENITEVVYTEDQIESGEKLWRSTRNSAVFSKDGGKTWEDHRLKTTGVSLTKEEAIYGITQEDLREKQKDTSVSSDSQASSDTQTSNPRGSSEPTPKPQGSEGGSPEQEPGNMGGSESRLEQTDEPKRKNIGKK